MEDTSQTSEDVLEWGDLNTLHLDAFKNMREMGVNISVGSSWTKETKFMVTASIECNMCAVVASSGCETIEDGLIEVYESINEQMRVLDECADYMEKLAAPS